MPRLFLALDLDGTIEDALAAAGESLRGHRALSGARARFVKRDVMHVTLRFLGEVDDALLPALAALTARLGAGRAPYAVEATSLLAFPDPRRARVLAAALADGRVARDDGDGSEPGDDGMTAQLARVADEGAAALGFAREDRAFRAHLTLARLRAPADVRRLLAETPLSARGAARAITLYRSDTRPEGPVYTPLARAELGG